MRRAIRAGLSAIVLAVVVAGPVAQANHNWNCRDISLKLAGKAKTSRTVCYPCEPDLLPEGTPEVVVDLWAQEVCAPAAKA